MLFRHLYKRRRTHRRAVTVVMVAVPVARMAMAVLAFSFLNGTVHLGPPRS